MPRRDGAVHAARRCFLGALVGDLDLSHSSEVGPQLVHQLIPVVGRLGEHLRDDVLEQRRHVRARAAERGRRVVQDLRGGFQPRGRAKRVRAGHGFVEHHAQREDVRPAVDLVPPHLFRRHVGQRAQDGAALGQIRTGLRLGIPSVHTLGQPEVEHLHMPACREHDVRRLQVAMDDLGGLRRFEGLADLHRDPEDLPQRHRLGGQPVLEGPAADILHGDERLPCRLAGLVDLADVGVVEGRRRLGLPEEPPTCVGILLQPLGQELQRHRAVERAVLGRKTAPMPPSPSGESIS